MSRLLSLSLAGLAAALVVPAFSAPAPIERIKYNNPGLKADVGVGLWGWPLPIDYNHDGLMDLVVVGSGKPYNGTDLFEDSGVTGTETGLPKLKAGVRLGVGIDSPEISYVGCKPIVLTPGKAYPDFTHTALAQPQPLNAPSVNEIFGSSDPSLTKPGITGIRSSQW